MLNPRTIVNVSAMTRSYNHICFRQRCCSSHSIC